MPYYQPTNYGSRLPVSPEQPDNRCGANATPNIRVDLGPMNEFTPVLVDALVMEIQNHVGQNAVRTFAFNLWGQNGYLNQDFVELLGVFAGHCEGRLLSQRNANPVQVIQGAAGYFMNAAMGLLIEHYPELANYLPPEAGQALQAARSDWYQITRDLRAMQSQYAAPVNQGYGVQGQGYGYQPAYGQGGYQTGGYGYPNQAGMGFNGARGQANAMAGRGDPRPIWDQQGDTLPQWNQRGASMGLNGGAYRESRPQPPVTRSVVTPERQPPATATFPEKARIVRPGAAPQGAAPTANRPAANRPTPAPAPATRITPAPKQELGTRFYDHVYLKDGSELYAAVVSPHRVQWTPERPPLAFDRDQFMLFHRVNQQAEEGVPVLQETVQKKVVEMEYLDHELDESLKKLYRQEGSLHRQRGVPQMAVLKRLVPDETGKVGSLVSKERLEALDAAKAPRVLTKPIIADSVDGSIAEAHLELLRHGGDGKTMEFLLKQCREYCLDKGAYSAVLDFRRATTYEALLDKLVTHALENPDSELADICNERLTRSFNRFLNKSMYFSWTIDSLMEDYMAAKEKIAASAGEMIQEQFAKSVRYVIDQALSVLDEQELNTWFARHLPEEVTDTFEEPVVFVDPLTVTTIPWTMYDLEKRFRLEGLVTKDLAGELYEALEAVFLRTTDPSAPADAQTKMKLREHVIVTSDGRKLYARASYLSPDLEHFAVTLEPLIVVPPREVRA